MGAVELGTARSTAFERGEEPTASARCRLILGDVLDVAGALHAEGLAGKVACVYVDPPYASQANYVHEARLDGAADGRVKRSLAYQDSWSTNAYLDMLAPRLEALVGLLAPAGTIWVQVDWRASHYVRLLLDEIMGPQRFLNEIVWKRAPNLGRQAASAQFGRTLDTIIVYGKKDAKLTPPTRLDPIDDKAIRWDEQGRPFTAAPRGDYTDDSIARLDKEGRIHRAASGKVYIKYFLVKDDSDRWCRERRVDALWTDVAPLRHSKLGERTGYPTQKPMALLERVIAAATKPGDLVVDLFCGSGTTAAAAHSLARRAVVADRAPIAIANAHARLLRSGASPSLETCGEQRLPSMHAEVSVRRVTATKLVLTLLEPTEPLAWTAGALVDGVLTRAWKDERAVGGKTTPVTRTAELELGAGEALGVHVFEDEGNVARLTLAAAALPVLGESATIAVGKRSEKAHKAGEKP
ncbi:MAG: site-specific DNA-methyltransferase [Polyangiaceae bacterium]